MLYGIDRLFKGSFKMVRDGFKVQDNITIVVRRNHILIGEVTATRTAEDEVICKVYLAEEHLAETLDELLEVGSSAAKHRVVKPLLRKLLRERIAELRAEEAAAEEKAADSPAD